MNEQQRQLRIFADNLKKTSLGINFSRKLFTDPYSLSPKQITETLKALGVNVPAEVQATAEVAQIISTGQAIKQAYDAGQDIRSMTNASAASIRAVNLIARENNWIDSDTASVVSYGANIALILSSGGANVAGWIGLAMDVASTVATKQGEADMAALKNLSTNLQKRVSGQVKILGETFKDFQEERISVFGLISKMAVETPDLWPQIVNQNSPFAQMFPELLMLPVTTATITGQGSSSIRGDWPWPASGSYIIRSWSSKKSISISSIDKMSKEDAAEYFFNILLKPWLWAYMIANDEIVSRGNMAMENIAALSFMVNPSGEISASEDYVNMLLGAQLTPYDFGDPILESIAGDFVNSAYVGIDTMYKEQAISYSNTNANAGFRGLTRDQEIMRLKLLEVKRTDDIWTLVKYPYIYNRLKSYMDFEQVSFEKDPTMGGKINERFTENSVTAWRKLHNYMAVLNMLETFRTDSYLRNTKFAEQLLPFMPSAVSFEKKVQEISYLSTMRSINSLAEKNLAQILNVKPTQLKKVSSEGAAKFEII